MSERIPYLSTAIPIAVLVILSACATGQLPVGEKLDEQTSVTITYSRTPLIMSPDTPYDREAVRDYVQIGVIETNRMGTLEYFLWLGISDYRHTVSADSHPNGFESIILTAGSEDIRVDVRGWTHKSIGASEPVYKKLFPNSSDAYYQITLDQLQLLIEADALRFQTTGSASKEFVPWYAQANAKSDLAEFLRTVLE